MKRGRIVAEGPTREVLTSAAVAALYDIEAEVAWHSRAGHLTVTPIQRGAP
jgi:ABC-type cobalamin/Fe3+-siderophores transport system ATPase subunit